MPRAALPLWCIIHTDSKGTARVWLEAYGARAIGARLYAATVGFELEEGDVFCRLAEPPPLLVPEARRFLQRAEEVSDPPRASRSSKQPRARFRSR
jgi:hypothetical protein